MFCKEENFAWDQYPILRLRSARVTNKEVELGRFRLEGEFTITRFWKDRTSQASGETRGLRRYFFPTLKGSHKIIVAGELF